MEAASTSLVSREQSSGPMGQTSTITANTVDGLDTTMQMPGCSIHHSVQAVLSEDEIWKVIECGQQQRETETPLVVPQPIQELNERAIETSIVVAQGDSSPLCRPRRKQPNPMRAPPHPDINPQFTASQARSIFIAAVPAWIQAGVYNNAAKPKSKGKPLSDPFIMRLEARKNLLLAASASTSGVASVSAVCVSDTQPLKPVANAQKLTFQGYKRSRRCMDQDKENIAPSNSGHEPCDPAVKRQKSQGSPKSQKQNVKDMVKDMDDEEVLKLVVDRSDYPDFPEGKTLPKISWAGKRLTVDKLPHVEKLGRADRHAASILRIPPKEFLAAKYQLIDFARKAVADGVEITKKLTQGAVGIDGNKTSRLHDYFMKLGWIPNRQD
ncbi:hypothetical protein GQ42DRAFT_177236 [Ramicandelaber brevisporus]|nr:hypothetical protein GQ42DRAFT_177236 [Ramicandelaber brevisporus]